MTRQVAIVVVNFNGWDDTRACLRSLQSLDGRVILVDNASADDRCAEILAEFPTVQVVRNSINGGWAGGNNAGIRIALEHDADSILLLNNDTVVSPRLLKSLRSAAGRHPDFGIIGPVICWMDEPDRVMTDGCAFNHPHEEGFFHRRAVSLTGQVTEVEIVNGCAMMVSADVFRRIGLIDERFFLIHEESDFCLRARKAGFRCGVLGEELVWHKGSSSFARSGKKLQRYYDARNLLLLLNKHRGHREGRDRADSLRAYFRYVYHRYCLEREQGNVESAAAVVAGMCDALRGRFGAMNSRHHWATHLVAPLLELVRRSRSLLPI